MSETVERSQLFKQRFRRLLSTVAVFALLGPPIGAIVYFVAISLIGMGQEANAADLAWVALFALIYASPISYMLGILPALLAGFLIGIWQAFVGRATLPVAIVAGSAIGFGLVLWSGLSLSLTSVGTAEGGTATVLFATCFISTLFCWLVVRRWTVLPSIWSRNP